jgi:Uncharacterized membrane-associated protein
MRLLQLEETPSRVQELFDSEFAFLILFLLCILEGGMMLRFMPSELVVPSALILIGSTVPEVVTIITVAVAGTTAGQLILFLLVRHAGKGFVIRSRWIPVGEDRLERFAVWFDRWGTVAVPVSNTMPFVRGLLTVPAGLSGLNWRRFALLSAMGTTLFQTILAVLYLYTDQVLA